MSPEQVVRVGRLGTAAAWISAVCCVPYLVLKILWAADVPVGITDRAMLDDGGWVAANALMAVLQLVALVLVLALVRPWSHKVPAWLLLLPVWVGTGMLFQVAVGAALLGLDSSTSEGSSVGTESIRPWVFVVVYSTFAGQGVALAIAFAAHVRARWGRLLGHRTGDVLSAQPARTRSWPERHLAASALSVAALAVVVAPAFCYWAAGGTFGLSDAQTRPTGLMQVSRVVGIAVTVVGLLAVAGRWGGGTRFWLPATLLWLGSGAMVAFDGFNVGLTNLFAVLGSATTDGWTLGDTAVVIKALVGVLAAGVGLLALRAAVTHDRLGVSRASRRTERRLVGTHR